MVLPARPRTMTVMGGLVAPEAGGRTWINRVASATMRLKRGDFDPRPRPWSTCKKQKSCGMHVFGGQSNVYFNRVSYIRFEKYSTFGFVWLWIRRARQQSFWIFRLGHSAGPSV